MVEWRVSMIAKSIQIDEHKKLKSGHDEPYAR